MEFAAQFNAALKRSTLVVRDVNSGQFRVVSAAFTMSSASGSQAFLLELERHHPLVVSTLFGEDRGTVAREFVRLWVAAPGNPSASLTRLPEGVDQDVLDSFRVLATQTDDEASACVSRHLAAVARYQASLHRVA
jgi:hypothetical protein